ncbi:MAG: hypothetical protein L3K04_00815 [Thermoplasmata archaeon]|nr:hypothetical protein [Thermoplasmata archaeon]
MSAPEAAAPAALPHSRPAPPRPAAPAPAAPAPEPPLAGEVSEHGSSQRASVRLLTWRVLGAAKVLGKVEVGSLDVNGLLSIGGDLIGGDARVRGSFSTVGQTRLTGRLSVTGQARCAASIEAGEAEFEGRAELSASLKVHGPLEIRGQLSVAGALDAQLLRFNGALAVTGAVRAREVDGTLEGVTHLASLTADRVQLRRPSFPPWKRGGSFRAERIDAKEVRLEAAHVEYLCAQEIRLGPDCHVSRAEGTIVERHRSSVVGYESSSPPPPGHFR